MPTVLNRHHYRGQRFPEPWIYVGRGHPLGNPYTVADHGIAALELYRRWLWKKIRERDTRVLGAMAQIREETHLVCSCAPRPCHADVIVRAWQWLGSQKWWRERLSP